MSSVDGGVRECSPDDELANIGSNEQIDEAMSFGRSLLRMTIKAT